MVFRCLFLLTGILLWWGTVKAASEKVCRGTETGMSYSGPARDRYEDARTKYTNCTFVDGNLELNVFNEEDNYDLSFLGDIREITGYLLINVVHADVIPLHNLRIIRGKQLFSYNNAMHGVYVALNYKRGFNSVGIKQLLLNSLHEISKGDVLIKDNRELCFVDTIVWEDIMRDEHARETVKDNSAGCEDCHGTCYKASWKGQTHCWAPGPSNCQELNYTTCARQCDGYCYDEDANDCCHKECAAGCTGPLRTDCWACRNFQETDGQCVEFCPPEYIYNREEFKTVKNPTVRYVFDTRCVMECPSYLVVDQRNCVRKCGPGFRDVDGYCEKCVGACPKRCDGTGDSALNGHHNHSNSIVNFEGCTTIEGNLQILNQTFQGHTYEGLPGINMSQLDLLRDVKEITGNLMIENAHLENLTFLANLEVIGGKELMRGDTAMRITYSSALTSLGLVSLKRVSNGHVVIAANPSLCFASSIDFNYLFPEGGDGRFLVRSNKDDVTCEAEGAVCDAQCSNHGCWGEGPRQCLTCRNYTFEGECVQSCEAVPRTYDAGNNTCYRCDAECANSCTGPGADDCDSCLHVKDGPYCRAECPERKYENRTDRTCHLCHENCLDNCTGPANNAGPGGCNYCTKALYNAQQRIVACLPPNLPCEDRHYTARQLDGDKTTSLDACVPCHELCRECKGSAPHINRFDACLKCEYVEEVGVCKADCTRDFYNQSNECLPCNSTCEGCYGPSSLDCQHCREMTIMISQSDGEDEDAVEMRMCAETCPEDHPYTDSRTENGVHVKLCVTYDPSKTKHMIIGLVLGAVVLLGGAAVIFIFCWRQRTRAQENVARLTAKITGVEELEPLHESGASPDMSNLRLIKEFELRKGKIIGSGAFGTVYSGVWVPEGEQIKIPVAIKEMRSGTAPGETKELLAEARVMASVRHPCCIRIIALCLTDLPMLITQLMPLGCLLEYIRQHQANIGSKVFLNWCTQIAKGMAYLETKGIVHRDLAARNVLVQSPNQVKITDFGLSKLLNINQEEYHANGGKMPLKWLALESIRYQVYTSKSDVWSYGVTMWEMFTYGGKPYENVSARDVLRLLEKGERLPQPSICTIDLYMVMINCWLVDAESRPSFRELVNEVAKMARDPTRYLVIQSDDSLRLPNQDQLAHNMLLRQMSVVAKHPGKMIDVDDYLQPQSLYTPTPPMSPSWNDPNNSAFFPSKGAGAGAGIGAGADGKPQRLVSHTSDEFPGAPCIKKQCSIPRQESTETRYTDSPCGKRSPVTPAEDYLPPIASGSVSKSPLGDEYLDPFLRQPPPPPLLPPPSDYLDPIRESFGENPTEGYLDMGGSTCTSPQTAIQNPLYMQRKPMANGNYLNQLSVASDESEQNYMNELSLSDDGEGNYVNQLDSPTKGSCGFDDEYDHLCRAPGVRDSAV